MIQEITDKSYSEMLQYTTFEDRFNYLKINGQVGFDTFGFDRYMNQGFYRSAEWKRIRSQIIIRDNGCDMGLSDRPIRGRIYIHHINPISEDDIINSNPVKLLDPENLICVSQETHNALHYGNIDNVSKNEIVERTPGDTCPWK